jgi:hypothetical protein
VKQEALRERLLLESDLLIADVVTTARDLTPSQLAWNPPEGGWSIAQVLEHLVMVADTYYGVVRPLVYSPLAPAAELGRNAWDPTWMGWLLVASLRSRRRMRAPRIWQVGPDARPGVLQAFLDRQRVLVQLLRAAAALDWRRVRLRSPASGLIRLNLGDAFTALVVHAQRHAQQMERVRRHARFQAA